MKERACKTSSSYNEFKQMVAAAHLKKLSSAEVASLRNTKKGWEKKVQGTAGLVDTQGAYILSDESRIREQQASGGEFLDTAEIKLPKNVMELARDLRRRNGVSDKLSYLSYIGLKKAKLLFKKQVEIDLLEQLLLLVSCNDAIQQAEAYSEVNEEGVAGVTLEESPSSSSSSSSTPSVFSEIEKIAVIDGDKNDKDDSDKNKEQDTEEKTTKKKFVDPFKWIKALTAVEGFSLKASMFDDATLNQCKSYLTGCQREGADIIVNRFP
jgi:hypothetical protein